MTFSKTAASAAAIALLMGTGALFATTAPAAARVVCSSSGDCWHTDHQYKYDRSVGAQYHNDDWYFHQKWTGDNQHHYRDSNDGRGYYKSGVWVTF
jgi:hypothetical protein